MRFIVPAVLVLMAFGGQSLSAQGQVHIEQDGGYTFAAIGIPLQDALDRVIDHTAIDIVYESRLVTGRSSFCRIDNADADSLLRCLLKGTGLDYVQLSSGTYVIRSDVRTKALRGGIVGQVIDAESGSPVAGANVIVAGAGLGAATNADGRFAFTGMLPGPHELVVSHVAFETRSDSVDVASSRTQPVSIAVEPRILLSSPVVVTGFEERAMSSQLGSAASSDLDELKGIGATDLSHEMGTLLGVRLGDALSEVHVQGGGSDEQRFVLDGAPIFMPVPSGGFIGAFSPFAVDQVTVHKAGFGVEHGSHLSGVVDLSHDLAAAPALALQVDPLSLNGKVDGRTDLSSDVDAVWMISGRRAVWDTYHPPQLETLFQGWSTPDIFLRSALESPSRRPVRTGPAADIEDGNLEVGFTDLHAAARLRLGDLRSLKVAAYRGANSFGVDEVILPEGGSEIEFEDAYRWRNRAVDARYEWVASGRLLMDAEWWMSDYVLNHPSTLAAADSTGDDLSHEFNQIREKGIRLSGDAALASRHFLHGGIEAVHTGSRFSIALDPLGASRPNSIQPITWRLAGFVEDRIGLSRTTSLEVGSRITFIPAKRKLFAEPRLALRFDGLRGRFSARGAVGVYRQFVHSFDVATYNVASLLPRVRFWLPVGKDHSPAEAYHAAAAFAIRPSASWRLEVESYYKHQPHLLTLNYGDLAGPLLTDADGFAYGIGLKIERRTDRIDAQVQYEYSIAERRVTNRFDGRYVAVPWSAPHRFTATVDAAPMRRTTFTARWQVVLGRMWGFRQAYYDVLATSPDTRVYDLFDLGDPEAHRLLARSQLDLGIAYSQPVGWAVVQARLYVINALARRNVTDWTLRYDESANEYLRKARHGMPFLPGASLTIQFSPGASR